MALLISFLLATAAVRAGEMPVPPCAAQLPADFTFVSSEKSVSQYRIGGGPDHVAIACLDAGPGGINAAAKELEKVVTVTRLSENGFFYEIARSGVGTRTYLLVSKKPGLLLQISWVAPEGKLPPPKKSLEAANQIRGD